MYLPTQRAINKYVSLALCVQLTALEKTLGKKQ